MVVGETLTVSATIQPSNATFDGITWSSTNSQIASVSTSGQVLALSEGNSTIIAAIGNISAQCQITVKPQARIIEFEDWRTKSICVKNWDTNKDNELSFDEAEAVKDIGQTFNHNTEIGAFKEFQYFTSVSSLPDRAFETSTLTEIILPSSIKTIGEGAFVQCSRLTGICIPDSVISVGNIAFSECTSLQKIVFPDSITDYGSGVLSYCVELTSVTLPEKITSLGRRSFYNCKKLETIELPSGLTEIGSEAFSFCGSLEIETLPESIVKIGKEAFAGILRIGTVSISHDIDIEERGLATLIDNLTINHYFTVDKAIFGIPNTLTFNTEKVFPIFPKQSMLNRPIPHLILGDNVRIIEDNAFKSISIEQITILSDGISIGRESFSDCRALSTFDFNKVNLLGYRSFYGTGIINLTLSEGFTAIPSDCFRRCGSLKQVDLPSTITSIGNRAFSDSAIEKVIVRATTPPVLDNDYCFYHPQGQPYPIYVPKESVSDYKKQWTLYTDSIVPIEE